MIKHDEKSNGQAWELEITCKSKQYLDAVVKAILSDGMIDFEVQMVEPTMCHDEAFDARYLVLSWAFGFSRLASFTKELAKIERKFEKY